jgi:hypothetical protein
MLHWHYFFKYLFIPLHLTSLNLTGDSHCDILLRNRWYFLSLNIISDSKVLL